MKICEFRICIWVIHKLDLKQEDHWSYIAHLSDVKLSGYWGKEV